MEVNPIQLHAPEEVETPDVTVSESLAEENQNELAPEVDQQENHSNNAKDVRKKKMKKSIILEKMVTKKVTK